MKKKPFLLLEVLIALFLISLFILPLATLPFEWVQRERVQLEKLERGRLASLTFLEIKEKMLSRQISWEMIPPKGEEKGPFPLSPVLLDIPGFAPKRIERSFQIACKGQKEGPKEEIYRSLRVQLILTPPLPFDEKEKYEQYLIVCQKPDQRE